MKPKQRFKPILIVLLVLIGLTGVVFRTAFGDENKWIAIGMLHNWYSSGGFEPEVWRRHLVADQQDGLIWPALFEYNDIQAAKALWIGAKDYNDPLMGTQFPYKVIHIGPRVMDESNEIFSQNFLLYGKESHPLVVVDGQLASHTVTMDDVGEIDPSLKADRKLHNEVNTAIGVTIYRDIYAFSQQYNDNYHIFDFVFKNTGIYTKSGAVNSQTLHDVVVMVQFRYAPTRYAAAYGYQYAPQSVAWGHSTVNDILHPFYNNPTKNPYNLRGFYSWLGLHSKYGADNIGGPNTGSNKISADGFLGAAQFPGIVVLHADQSASIETDDPDQPKSAPFFSSDADFTQFSYADQFNASHMETEYKLMTKGIPPQTHAQLVGNQYADAWQPSATETNPGGYTQAITFGPYDLAPGEDVHVVMAEGVNGLSRSECKRIGNQWYKQQTPYIKPDGSSATDRDVFKNTWVFTGKDSITQTFLRAKAAWDNGLVIAPPPPPPSDFTVNSGGDRISLSWSNSAESYANFNGYRIYRAIHTPDTTFDLIYECGQGTANPNVVNTYDDRSALRGFDYYYYVTTFDDGSVNTVEPGRAMESNLFWTRTNSPAYLRRPAGTALSDIRIVPNPYNISAKTYQFGSSAPDRIMFFNIPPKCRIKIFTEAGELINTIEHTNNSGDEAWNLVTSSRQVIVSGLYIAYFEVTEDFDDPNTGQPLFKKGESTYQKFIVIR